MGGSLAPVRVAGFTWNGWQPSAVYAGNWEFLILFRFTNTLSQPKKPAGKSSKIDTPDAPLLIHRSLY
ncbi:hypothetical protein, partial [Marinobacter goseongensis]|uniref:hypothetical protein n=1 Tax=Marinobacter goseongensis TaxID=453838 RepID=UPI002004FC7B